MHTPKHAILFFKVLICCTVLCAGKPCLLFSGTTDQWVQKAGAAVTDLAKGNPQGALYQAAPCDSNSFAKPCFSLRKAFGSWYPPAPAAKASGARAWT